MKPPLVIDASVALKWFAKEEGHAEARAILASDERLIAPDLVVVEAVNGAWSKWRRGELDAADVARVAQAVPWSFCSLVESRELAARAALISVTLRHPVYDCMYLALAEDRNTVVVTADGRLRKAVKKTAWAQHVRALIDRPDDE